MFLFKSFLQVPPEIPLQTTLTSSSGEAEQINQLVNYFFIASAFMLLIVIGLTIYILLRFNHKKNPDIKKGFSQKWEYVMIGIPLLLVILFFILSIRTSNRILPSAVGKKPDVVITAHQWWWQAGYPGTGVITANEIHLPVGKKILLELRSADVIHSWWVPQLGNKMDLVPSGKNFLWTTIKRPGKYYGRCSEFCGDQHANMQITVVAETEEKFNEWLTQQKQPVQASDSLSKGQLLFAKMTCSNCHRISGTAANGDTGPDLTHIASRETLLAGRIVNSPPNLELFIREPQKAKPGIYMPDFALNDSSVKALAAYLSGLK